ncbi:MAG: hypothetical protein MZV70_46990 [Desulfobacterales bacterium]|nr:hypothetical protein [Desulfobacterales bacterium]
MPSSRWAVRGGEPGKGTPDVLPSPEGVYVVMGVCGSSQSRGWNPTGSGSRGSCIFVRGQYRSLWSVQACCQCMVLVTSSTSLRARS